MNRRSLFVSAAVLGCIGLWSTNARAEIGVAPFDPSTDFRLEEEPISTGLVPGGDSAISVGLTVTPYQDVSILMFGDGNYDFDETEINFEGTPDSGVFTNTLGAEVTVTVVVDFVIEAEFEVGVYSIEEDAVADFTPYVLPGADPRPIEVAEEIGPFALVDMEPFTVPGFGNEGTLDIDFRIDIPGISYESTHIDIADGADADTATELGEYAMEDSFLELLLPEASPGETSSIWGELNGLLDSEIAFVFEITVSLQLVGDTPTVVGPFEIGVDVPVREDVPVVFQPEEMEFTVPEDPVEGTSTGAAGTTTGEPATTSDSDSDSAGEGTTTDLTGTSGGAPPDTEGLPADNVGSDDGCGCTTTGQPGHWGLGLAMLGLIGIRRRRR